MRYAALFLVFIACPLWVWSCTEKVDIEEWQRNVTQTGMKKRQGAVSVRDSVDYDWPADSLLRRTLSGVETARRRARQLVKIKWSPYANVPSCYGIYPKMQEQTGIPYSLAYMTNTQVGTQVSLHTYMTALQNPYSVQYTEDLSKSPYNGSSDSAPYYGSTCSNSVMYVLGIEPPYFTRMIGVIPGMKKAKEQSPDSIELCDVLWKSGHVMMVYDIERNEEGAITQVCIFETTSYGQRDTWFNRMSYEDYVTYWNKSGIIRYQYAYLDRNTEYEASVFVPLEDEPVYSFQYNYELCPTLGDRCSYLEGKDVRLAVLSDYYQRIVLYKDGEEYLSVDARRPITTISGLPYGEYRACLVRDDARSGYVHFEIIGAHAEAEGGNQVRIRFSGENASARYISVCAVDGRPYNYYTLKDSEREGGSYSMSRINSVAASHYQVFFKGRYGVVATDVKPL